MGYIISAIFHLLVCYVATSHLLKPRSLLFRPLKSSMATFSTAATQPEGAGVDGASNGVAKALVKSLRSLSADDKSTQIDWTAVEAFVTEVAPLNYKNWKQTADWAEQLDGLLGNPTDRSFQSLFERVLCDGNWYGAATEKSQNNSKSGKPWVVLVTGLNGIRKTTSLYQPWFREVLDEALVSPLDSPSVEIDTDDLPTGQNGFFRQLDYMIATLANEEFRELYLLVAEGLSTSEYSTRKDIIFKRYRTVAEILGVLLLHSAKKLGLNSLVETSGRDIASFDYVDYLYPTSAQESSYRKLVLHFTIDDIRYAEQSVDARMAAEMVAGSKAASVSSGEGGNTKAIVAVNAGGPYGSEVLRGVQADSERVWAQVLQDPSKGDWFKASIAIYGSDDPAGWSARAVRPDGSISSKQHFFQRNA